MTGRIKVGDVVFVKLGFWPFGVTTRAQILGNKKHHWKRRLFWRGGRISLVETYRAYILSDNEGLYRDEARFINIRESKIVEIIEKRARPQDDTRHHLPRAPREGSHVSGIILLSADSYVRRS